MFNRGSATLNLSKRVSQITQGKFKGFNNLTEVNIESAEAKINGFDFSKPDQITQDQLNEFKESLGLTKYCNIKVAGQIIEPDSNAKIEQCQAILEGHYRDEFKAVIRSQMAYSLRKIGNREQALEEIGTLRNAGYLKNNDLLTMTEWKKQCISNCNKVLNFELNKIETKLGYIHEAQKYTKKVLPIVQQLSKKKDGRDM